MIYCIFDPGRGPILLCAASCWAEKERKERKGKTERKKKKQREKTPRTWPLGGGLALHLGLGVVSHAAQHRVRPVVQLPAGNRADDAGL